MAVVGIAKWATHPLSTALPPADLLGLRWLLASTIVVMGNYILFGLPIIRAYAHSQMPPSEKTEDTGGTAASIGRAKALISRGGAVAFVLAGLLAGSLPAAWWYGRQRHPRVRRYAWYGALIYGTVYPATWLGLFSAQYRAWTIAVVPVVVVAGIVYYHRKQAVQVQPAE
jgi:hypothetical protein